MVLETHTLRKQKDNYLVKKLNINYKNKIVEVGNIIREEIINTSSKTQEGEFDNLKILVLGGSQAAKIFAVKLPYIFKKLSDLNINLKISIK